jgi:hypothetical protein
MRRAVLAIFVLVAACAQSRAEERAIEYALSIGYTSPAADCDQERENLPGFLICNVQELEPELRGFQIACPSGLADAPCVEPPPAQDFGLSGGAL